MVKNQRNISSIKPGHNWTRHIKTTPNNAITWRGSWLLFVSFSEETSLFDCFVLVCCFSSLLRHLPVVAKRIIRRKPPPNPKSLATFSSLFGMVFQRHITNWVNQYGKNLFETHLNTHYPRAYLMLVIEDFGTIHARTIANMYNYRIFVCGCPISIKKQTPSGPPAHLKTCSRRYCYFNSRLPETLTWEDPPSTLSWAALGHGKSSG